MLFNLYKFYVTKLLKRGMNSFKCFRCYWSSHYIIYIFYFQQQENETTIFDYSMFLLFKEHLNYSIT